jgi:hypothetical protein
MKKPLVINKGIINISSNYCFFTNKIKNLLTL